MRPDLNPVPLRIHGDPVVAHRPATHAASEICVVVLVRRSDDYVTWTYNCQNPGAHSGHYGMTLDKAAGDFAERHGRTRPTFTRDVTVTDAATADERTAVSNAVGACHPRPGPFGWPVSTGYLLEELALDGCARDEDRSDYGGGDPRRCPHHPNVKTSSDDGMFDAPCGECEMAMYLSEMGDNYPDAGCACGTVGCPGGAGCPNEIQPDPEVAEWSAARAAALDTRECGCGSGLPPSVCHERPVSDPVVLLHMGHPVRASAFGDDIPF